MSTMTPAPSAAQKQADIANLVAALASRQAEVTEAPTAC
jgi:hypothetical protein